MLCGVRLLLDSTIFRGVWFTLGRRGRYRKKEMSGTTRDQHRCRKGCSDSEIVVAVRFASPRANERT